jgi:hypothetical protein
MSSPFHVLVHMVPFCGLFSNTDNLRRFIEPFAYFLTVAIRQPESPVAVSNQHEPFLFLS